MNRLNIVAIIALSATFALCGEDPEIAPEPTTIEDIPAFYESLKLSDEQEQEPLAMQDSKAAGSAALSPESQQVFQQIAIGFNENPLEPHLIEQLRQDTPEDISILINTLNNSSLINEWPHAILLEGKPGVGKSTYAKFIAHETGRHYFFIRTATLANEYQHSGSSNIDRIFRTALEIARFTPLIIIFDEINAISDFGEKGEQKRMVDSGTSEALWMWLDVCAKQKNILVIGTTNDATKMRDQLVSRFDGDVINIDIPDKTAYRQELLQFYLSTRLHSCTERSLKQLAGKTKGFTPRAIEKLVIKARQYAALREPSTPIIEADDFNEALRRIAEGRVRTTKSFLSRMGEQFYNKGVPSIQAISSLCAILSFGINIYYLATGQLGKRL